MTSLLFNVNGTFLSLDNTKGEVSFISHAHSDHIRRKIINKVIASKETLHISGILGKRVTLKEIKLFDAGHIPGAKQISIDLDGNKIGYTGDIRLKKGIFNKKADIMNVDEIYIDGTYANPIFKFQDPFNIYDDIIKWINLNNDKIIVFGAYPLGKTQELVKIFNENGITPILHNKNYEYTKKYVELGIRLYSIKAGTDEAHEIMRDGAVLIVPNNILNYKIKQIFSFIYNKRVLFAKATGWALKYNFKVDKAFPLSDHSDFYDIVEYIELSGAKKVHVLFSKSNKYLYEYFKRKNMVVY